MFEEPTLATRQSNTRDLRVQQAGWYSWMRMPASQQLAVKRARRVVLQRVVDLALQQERHAARRGARPRCSARRKRRAGKK